jgi:hypothetical protein
MWWHHLETVWLVRCSETPLQIRDRLQSLMGSEDQLLIVDIADDTAEWSGINEAGTKWLRENIRPALGHAEL